MLLFFQTVLWLATGRTWTRSLTLGPSDDGSMAFGYSGLQCGLVGAVDGCDCGVVYRSIHYTIRFKRFKSWEVRSTIRLKTEDLASSSSSSMLSSSSLATVSTAGRCMPRAEMLQRAATCRYAKWVGTVAYSHELNASFGFPTDCSGLVDWSMNATVPGSGGKPDNIKAYQFPSPRYSTRITKSEITGGDILTHLVCKRRRHHWPSRLGPVKGPIGGHVIVFDKWVEPQRDQFWAFESSESFDQTLGCLARTSPCFALHTLKNWSENGVEWGELHCQSAEYGNCSGGAHRVLPSIVCPISPAPKIVSTPKRTPVPTPPTPLHDIMIIEKWIGKSGG
jgi:hypothetical protein